jgi:lipopolysaccharide assembly outer membrane protein LptD (OstA)
MPAALRTTLALLLAWACASAAGAQPVVGESRGFGEEPIELTADALDYDAAEEIYTASGDVVLRQGARTLRADWMTFNRRTGMGMANGHVELREGEEVLRADFVEFDVDTVQGLVRDGEIDSPDGQFRAQGEEIRKTGERSYSFRRGVFTTCRCPNKDERVPWQIRAREAELDIGGYGTVRDATIDVLGVPVAWLPWLFVPLRTERQTGLLLPEVAFGSRRGFEFGVPFFWAAREDLNVTLTPYYSVRRGYKQNALFEYVFGRESSGELFGAFAYDQDIEPNSDEEPFDRERWSVLGQQDWMLPGSARFRTDFRFTSDNDYPIDFEELRTRRTDRWLESWASLSRDFGPSGRLLALGASRYADDMQNPDDVDRDDTSLQRLPELALAALPGAVAPLPWLTPAFDVSYTAYQSIDRAGDSRAGFEDTGPDGVPNEREGPDGPGPSTDPHNDNFDAVLRPGGGEGDGVFEEGEPLTDEGHRFRLNPRLAAPMSLAGLFELYPEIGWSETLYATRLQSFDRRGLLTGRVDLRTRLRRHFGNLSHVVEPTLGYAYVSPESQSENPLFQPGTAVPQERVRALDLDAVTRDSADRIPRANKLTWGAVQRLRLPGSDANAVDAEVTLLGSYELEQEDFGWVVADGSVDKSRFGATRFHVGYDPEKTRLAEALIDWTWLHQKGHRVSLGYRYLRDIPDYFEDFQRGERFDNFDNFERVEQVFTELRFRATPQWLLGFRTAFSFEREVFLQNVGLVEYLSRCGCWAGGIELSVDRASGVDVRVLYRLVGLGRTMERSRLLDAFEGL